jgi:hypothetical protein
MFGPKRGGVKGGWSSLYNEKPNNLYPAPNIIRIKSRKMGWKGM